MSKQKVQNPHNGGELADREDMAGWDRCSGNPGTLNAAVGLDLLLQQQNGQKLFKKGRECILCGVQTPQRQRQRWGRLLWPTAAGTAAVEYSCGIHD